MNLIYFSAICVSFSLVWDVRCLLIPDELPSLLSVIYSNIPTIRKGTDSRFGVGFRLGNRADFQIITELGPQKATRPLGNQIQDDNKSKRDGVDSLSDILYAQQKLRQQNQQTVMVRPVESDEQVDNSKSAKSLSQTWLEEWYKSVVRQPQTQSKPGIAVGEVDAKSVLPNDDGDEVRERL